MNRREMIKMSGMAAMGTAMLGIPGITAAAQEAKPEKSGDRLKVMVIGAHPDDPETGCGGTMCLFADAGHEVVCVYLTRGEAGIAGMDPDKVAAIRVKESEAACRITGARHIFMDQADSNTVVNVDRYLQMRRLIESENPDIVFTHWPIDAHRDHAACGMLVLDAWRRVGRTFRLFYFEVMSGEQTQMFTPTHWVNIESVVERKHKACFCHESQGMDQIYDGWHTWMEKFRGMECRCGAAEAFALHAVALPGL